MTKEWWKEAVVYQIYPKSFKDSNADGIGDIPGIIGKLDYIRELGADVIWICPVYQSPMDDNGYDISDYYHVDPMFGTDADLELLIQEAQKRGIRIVMDLVINHTSDEHPWFQEAIKNPGSKYRDYYIFRQGQEGGPPNNWRTYFKGPAWERVPGEDTYYLHLFSRKQPDLNWENPQLRQELYRMINYWLEKGTAGFRVDAIGNIKKNIVAGTFAPDGPDGLVYPGQWVLNQKGIEVYLNELKEHTFSRYDCMTVAEADVPDELLSQFIGEQGFFSMVFDFSYTDIDVPESGEAFQPVEWTIAQLRERIFHSQMETQKKGWGAVYLENHDQCRSVNKYIPEDEISYYSTTMLAAMFMFLRGTPFIYQGQELGMTNCQMDNIEDYDDLSAHAQYERALHAGYTPEQALQMLYRRSRDNARTPFQWDDSESAGFTEGSPWLKVNDNYTVINLKQQQHDPGSVFAFYKKLIALRKAERYKAAAIYGVSEPVYHSDPELFVWHRTAGNTRLTIVCNFSNQEKRKGAECAGELLLSNYEGEAAVLRPYECVIYYEVLYNVSRADKEVE